MLGEKGWGRKAKVLMWKSKCRRRGVGWEMEGPALRLSVQARGALTVQCGGGGRRVGRTARGSLEERVALHTGVLKAACFNVLAGQPARLQPVQPGTALSTQTLGAQVVQPVGWACWGRKGGEGKRKC